MASMKEIDKVYNLFKKDKVRISLLHCISNYPNPETASYLSCLESLKTRFNCPIGLSDHTNDIKVALYAYILGAKIIEKHFTLDGNYKCIDKPVSINKKQMKQLNLEILHFKKIMGISKFGIRKEEQNTKIFKRK
jgi:sialic acid synthase SpsE